MRLLVASQAVQLSLKQQASLDIEFLGASTFIFSLYIEHSESWGGALTFSLENQEQDNLIWRLDVIRIYGKWMDQGSRHNWPLPEVIEHWLNVQQIPAVSGLTIATA